MLKVFLILFIYSFYRISGNDCQKKHSCKLKQFQNKYIKNYKKIKINKKRLKDIKNKSLNSLVNMF